MRSIGIQRVNVVAFGPVSVCKVKSVLPAVCPGASALEDQVADLTSAKNLLTS